MFYEIRFSVLKHRVLIDVQLHIFLHMPVASASKHCLRQRNAPAEPKFSERRYGAYCLRAPHNTTSVIGDPAEFRGGALTAQFSERASYQGNWRMHRLSWRISASKSSKETDGP